MNIGYQTTLDNNEKYLIWHIEGGLGKNIAATAIVEDVKNRYADRKLIMVVSYPEIFLNNPYIHRVYRVGVTSYLYEDYVKDKDTIIMRHEPYFQSDHIRKKKHLIHNWCDLLDIQYTNQLPKLYPNLIQKELQYNWQREKPILVLQTNGGGMGNEFSYSWTRDIPYELSVRIAEKYKNNYHVIQITRPITNLIPNVEHVTQQLSNFEMLSIIAVSQKRVLIDSFLQHAAAGMGLHSTVFWIGTSPINFGYDIHNNIVANEPPGTMKLIDSYLFDYSLEGVVHECPYNSIDEMFNMNEILKSV
jgi:hypothetical protein